MTKRDCVNYCETAITDMWKKYGKPTDFDKRCEVYVHCKDVCEKNGYTGECFVSIWNTALRKTHTANKN